MENVASNPAPSHLLWMHIAIWLVLTTNLTAGLSSTPSFFSLFDRFTVSCPADPVVVRRFDPSLVSDCDDISNEKCNWWVAVHRAANNKPSVFVVRDEFLNAMQSATNFPDSTPRMMSSPPKYDEAFVQEKQPNDPNSSTTGAPVAVARLYQPKNSDHFLLDSIRCVLKKEETDPSCDGSSEHAEALCVAIDTLLERYLETHDHFEGAIRIKATLVAAPLLESRGFVPVQSLGSDMASHVSSLDACFASYAERAVAPSRTPAARQRAINIVSRLGQIDRAADLRRRNQLDQANPSNIDNDPWQGMRPFI